MSDVVPARLGPGETAHGRALKSLQDRLDRLYVQLNGHKERMAEGFLKKLVTYRDLRQIAKARSQLESAKRGQ